MFPLRKKLALAVLAATGPHAAMACEDGERVRFDIPAQAAESAILHFAQQARLPVLFPSGAFEGIQANAVRGDYCVDDALRALLDGTPVIGTLDGMQQLVIRMEAPPPAPAVEPEETREDEGGLLSAIAAFFGGRRDEGTVGTQDTLRGPRLEEINITGTRIRRGDGMTTPVPVTALTPEELSFIDPGGTIAEQLDALPQFFGTSTAQRGEGTLYQGTGGGYLDLRGLGPQRTLVLFDGSRMVPADKRGSVNVETLPTALIRTIEVVSGGASAAYGADALGGVTNFVLDREFEGLKLQTGTGVTEYGDGERWHFSLAGGRRLSRDLHIIGSLQAMEIGQIQRDPRTVGDYFQRWGWVTNPAWHPGAPPGIPQRLTLPHVTSSEHSPSGVIWARHGSASNSALIPFALNGMTFTDDGSAVRPFIKGEVYADPAAPGSTKSMAGGPEAANHMRAFIGGPAGRHTVGRSGFLAGQYDLTDRLSGFAQVLVGRSESVFHADRGHHQLMDGWHLTVFRENAFLPPEVAAAMDTAGIRSFQLHKGGSYVGSDDINHDSVEKVVMGTWAWTIGFDALLPNGWDWRASWQQGESHKRSGAYDEIRTDRLFLAADAVRDPATGAIVCNVQLHDPTPEQLRAAVDGRHASPGGRAHAAHGPLLSPVGLDNTIRDCVPFNIMGAGGLSQAALDYVATPKITDDYVNQDFAETILTGELPGPAAGPLSFAAGLTWRQQSFADNSLPYEIEVLGPPLNAPQLGIRGFPPSYTGGSPNLHQHSTHPIISGAYDVWEWFGEFNVPVLETQGGQRVDASMAYRASDYSNIGRVASWKLGLDLQLTDDLRLRATKSRDVREATFSERFDSQGTGDSVVDPRFGNTTFQISSTAGGNPDLRPEKADTLVLGLVYQPGALPGLQLSTDWYEVNIRDAVGTLGVQRIIDLCETEGIVELCAQYDRDPVTGFIGTVRNTFLNVARAKVEGVDLELLYRAEPDFFPGQGESLDFRLLAGRLLERSDTPFGGAPHDFAGTLDYPDLTALATLAYGVGPYSVQLQQRHIAETRRDANWVEGIDVDDNSVASGNTTSLRLGYEVENATGGTWSVALNVSNLFDRAPPVIPHYSTRGGAQIVDPDYDIYGRRYQLTVSLNY